MPVINVIDSNTIDKVMPLLNTVVQPGNVPGIHVSIDTKNAAKSAHHRTRMIRSIVGARALAAMGGGGGSIVARGSRLAARLRIPGRSSSAAMMMTNGNAGTTAAFQKLFGGMQPWSTVVATPIRSP